MIYVYALTDPTITPPDICGTDNQPLRTVTTGGVSAVYTCRSDIAIPPLPENLLRHEQVVEFFMREPDRALLPARFATTFPSETHLEEVLSRHQAALKAGLDRVRGCVELGLRVIGPSADPADPKPTIYSTGREYMTALLGDQRRRHDSQRLAEELEKSLRPLAREIVQRDAGAGDVVMNSAWLVEHGRASDFASGVRVLAAAHPSLRLLCTGPWPAYHFSPSVKLAEALHG